MKGIAGTVMLALMAVAVGALFFSVGYAGAEWHRSGSMRLFAALDQDPLSAFMSAWSDIVVLRDYSRAAYGAAAALAGMALCIGLVLVLKPKQPKGAKLMSVADAKSAGLTERGGVFIGNIGGRVAQVFGPHKQRGSGRKRFFKARLRGGSKLWVDGDDVGGFVVGPPRSGKGAGLIIPNALMWPDSLVVLDMRGETYQATAGHRSTFSRVVRFSPADENGDTAFYNPLDFVRLDRGERDIDIRNMAAALFPMPTGSADPYWVKDARLLFSGITSYVMETPAIDDQARNLATILRIMNSADEPILDFIASLREERRSEVTEFTLQCLLPYVEMSDKQFSGLYGNIRTGMAPFMNERIARATSRSSFDIRNLKRERVSLYLDFRTQQILSLGPLFNVLITQLMNYMSNSLLGPGEHRVLIMLDEFQNLGKLENVMEMATILGGNGVPTWFLVQSLKAVDTIYREEGRLTLMNSARVQIFFGAQAPSDLREISELLGEAVEMQKDVTKTQATLFDTFYTRSVHQKEVRRPLMRPDEIRTMDRNRCIILPRGQNAILGTRNWYFADPALEKLAWKPLPKNTQGELTAADHAAVTPSNSDERSRLQAAARHAGTIAKPPSHRFIASLNGNRLHRGATFAAKAGPARVPIRPKSIRETLVNQPLAKGNVSAAPAPAARKVPDFAAMTAQARQAAGTAGETETRLTQAFAMLDSFAAEATDQATYDQEAQRVRQALPDVL